MQSTVQKRVMVRRPQIGRDTVLQPAEVLSQVGDTLRVRLEGETRVREVAASETSPMTEAFARQINPAHGVLPVRAFPTATNALGNR